MYCTHTYNFKTWGVPKIYFRMILADKFMLRIKLQFEHSKYKIKQTHYWIQRQTEGNIACVIWYLIFVARFYSKIWNELSWASWSLNNVLVLNIEIHVPVSGLEKKCCPIIQNKYSILSLSAINFSFSLAQVAMEKASCLKQLKSDLRLTQGKQNSRVTCPKGQLELKLFWSLVYSFYMHQYKQKRWKHFGFIAKINFFHLSLALPWLRNTITHNALLARSLHSFRN